jgi:hypothetical protein
MAGSADSYEQIIAEAQAERERLARERAEEDQQALAAKTVSDYTHDSAYGEGETVPAAEKAALLAYTGGLSKSRMDVFDDGLPRVKSFVDVTVEAALALGKTALGAKAKIIETKASPPETRSFPLKARSRRAARRLTERVILPALGNAFGPMELKHMRPIYKERSSIAFLPWFLRWKKKTFRMELSGRDCVEIRYQLPARVRVHFVHT